MREPQAPETGSPEHIIVSRPSDVSHSLKVVHRIPTATPSVGGPSARRQYERLYLKMALTDCVSVVLALMLGYELRFGFRGPSVEFLLSLAISPFLVMGIFSAFRLYSVHLFTSAEEVRRVLLAVSVTVTGLVTLSFWSNLPFSRVWIGLSWLFCVLFTLLSRRLWHSYVRRARRRGRLAFPTLIVGTNAEAIRLAHVMSSADFGFFPLGFVSAGHAKAQNNGLPVLGHIRDLRRLIQETAAECVFVASSAVRVEHMGEVSKTVRLEGGEVRVTANLPEVLSSRLAVQPVGGVMALSLKPVRLTGPQAIAKRAFDLVVSGTTLLVTMPLFAVIALAIRLSSPGPVFYRQERAGQQGRPFDLLKFRTMVVGAEAMLETLRGRNQATGPMFKMRDDPRITSVGRWLRRWSLDELPQLVNVLKGDMSLVGPRPPLPEEVRAYKAWQVDRLEVRPGITGLWQVSGRSDLSFDECVRLDLFYIENWSLAYDLFILAKTFPAVLSSRGAY